MLDPARLKSLKQGVAPPVGEDAEEDIPQISLAEMLDDLCLDDPDSKTMTEEM